MGCVPVNMNDDLKNDLEVLRSNLEHAAESAEEGGRTAAASVFESFEDDVKLLMRKHTEQD